MAELVVGDKPLALRSEGTVVGRHSDDGSFRPDIDLASLEGGRTVSRQHARIFERDGQWILRVEPTTKNPTMVAGQSLAAGQEAKLGDGDRITLGKVAAVFRVGEPPKPVIPELIEPTAELRCEDTAVPLAANNGQQLSLGRHSEDRSHMPDVDLADLPYGRTVSRRHGFLSFREGRWYLRVEADATNPTIVNGATLAKAQEVELNEGDRLQLGRVVVTFHQRRQIASVGEEQIELVLAPMQLRVEAGSEVEMNVTVVNHTGHVDWFRVELVGLREQWYRIVAPDQSTGPVAQVHLFHTPVHATPAADAVAQLRLIVAPPRDSQSRAGIHNFAITATSQGEPPARRVATSQLSIDPFQEMKATMEPEEISRPQGEFTLSLYNAGNDLAAVAVQIEADELECQADRQQLELANGGRDAIRIKTRVKRRHWFGSNRTHSMVVTVKSGDQDQIERALVSFPPRVPIWLQSLFRRVQPFAIPAVSLMLVLAVVFFVARPAEILEFKADPATVVAGQPVTLSWSVIRSSGISIDPATGSEKLGLPGGELKVVPAASGKYTLTARNRVGIQTSRSVNVEVKPKPELAKIVAFTASPEHVKKEGDPVTIHWDVSGATAVSIQPGDNMKNLKPSGDVTVNPTQNNAVFKLVATNDAGNQEASKTIVIDAPQITSFSANPQTTTPGGEVSLNWQVQGASKLVLRASTGEIADGKQEVEMPLSALSQTVKPQTETEYTLVATNAGGSDTKALKVGVGQAPVKIDFFTVAPVPIAPGDQATLSFSVQNAKKVVVQTSDGQVVRSIAVTDKTYLGSVKVSPGATTTYALVVSNDAGQTAQPATVEVKAPTPVPPPAAPAPAPAPPKP